MTLTVGRLTTVYDPGVGSSYNWGNTIQLSNNDLLKIGEQDSANLRIYKSSNDGLTWSLLSSIAVTPIYTMLGGSLWLRPHNGDVWAFYTERIAPISEEFYYIYYRVSTDSGATWGAAQAVFAGGDAKLMALHIPPVLLSSNGTLALPLSYELTGSSKSVIGIYNFGTGLWTQYNVATGTNEYNEWSLFETGSSRIVGILRSETDTNGFYRVYSDDFGATWSSPVLVYTNNNATWADTPHVIKIGSTIYLSTWYSRFVDGSNTTVDLRISLSSDDGLTWGGDGVTNISQLIAGGHGGGSSIVYLGNTGFLQTLHFSVGTTGISYVILLTYLTTKIMTNTNKSVLGLEILAMRHAAEVMPPYQRQDCPTCGWSLRTAADGIIECIFCGWTDQHPIVRDVPRP